MGKANDKQYGGTHYQCQTIQPWDYVTANNLGYLEGTAIKYISRWRHKNGIKDIRKAIHFLEKLVEVETANHSNQLELFPKLSSNAVMEQTGSNSQRLCVAGQSSSQAGNACLNGMDSITSHDDNFSSHCGMESAKTNNNVVGRFCHLCPMATSVGDTFPIPTHELNHMAILRDDPGCSSQNYV